MDNNRDKELVIRLQIDDVRAFDAIYRNYHQALFSNIFKLTRNADATEDILQEVFITLWEKRFTVDKNKPLSSWLFTVSYNKSIDYLKKILKESVKLTEFNEEFVVADERETTLREIQLNLVETAVKNLSPQKSKVFDLCKLKGKTYEETAKELNISKHTVKEYLSEAIIYIKKYIHLHPQSSSVFFGATAITTFM